MNRLAIPVAATFSGANPEFKGSEISGINYDLWLLRISLHFENRPSHVYVDFSK
jgi:hypothetical protein